MCIVYVIRSETSSKIYIGYTKDLSARLERHNDRSSKNKKSHTYKNVGHWVVVNQEKCNDVVSARKRERELKTARGREFIKQNMRP
jgi:putative endonuclease